MSERPRCQVWRDRAFGFVGLAMLAGPCSGSPGRGIHPPPPLAAACSGQMDRSRKGRRADPRWRHRQSPLLPQRRRAPPSCIAHEDDDALSAFRAAQERPDDAWRRPSRFRNTRRFRRRPNCMSGRATRSPTEVAIKATGRSFRERHGGRDLRSDRRHRKATSPN